MLIRGFSSWPTRATAAPARELPQERQGALEALLCPRHACHELRKELQGVLDSFSPAQVEKLVSAGYRISYECLPNHIGGIQNGYKKSIQLNPNWKPVERRRAAIHEITHALDFLRRQTGLGTMQRFMSRFDKPYASQLDGRLAHLYRGYLDRTASQATQPKDWQVWASGAARPALVTALAVGASLATGALPLTAAVAAAGTAWTGKKLAETIFAPREVDRFAAARPFPPDGEQAQFSEYAARAHKVYEYLAEGVAFYKNNAVERELLRQRDPGLYAYVEEWNQVA